ncbi:MAG: MFS transporter, partial [Acidobacteria bacterium]
MLPSIARSPSHFSEVRRSLSLSLYDGFFASVYAVLTGGFFLTGFALSLGATEWEIGLLAALPFVANWFQFVGSYLVQRMGRRAPVCVWTATTARLLWLLVALLPFSRRSHEDWIIWGLMVLVATSYFLGAISAVAWLSWIADVVPENLRGRFFGRRNMFNGIATVGTSLIGGWFLDAWGKTLSDFQWLFLVAVMAGLMSIGFLKRIPEPPLTSSPQKQAYFRALLRPLIDANFRRLLLFTMVWSFGVNLASP